MAYNFPVGYQPMQNYYPQAYQQQAVQQPQHNSIIWVQGEAGAKSYLVAPNTTVQLWDSEDQVIYLKSADASGMPSIKVLDYKIRSEAPKMPSKAFSTDEGTNIYKDQINGLQTQIDALRKELDALKGEDHEQSAV